MSTKSYRFGRTMKIATSAAILLGAGLLCVALFFYFDSYWSQHVLSNEWEAKELQKTAATAVKDQPVSAPAPRTGDVLAKLEIPKINLEAVIIEGIDQSTLRKGPGHYPGTALPGQEGNCVIAAHRDMFFRNVGQLDIDDTIICTIGEFHYTYRIVDKRVVQPTDLSPIDPTSTSTITLITCYPFNYIGPAPKRYIITARLAG